MAQAQRYAFETVFAKDGAILAESRSAPRFSADDVERARTEGVESGRAAEAQRAGQAQAKALDELARVAKTLLAQVAADRAALIEEAREVALAGARAIAGAALDAFGVERAEAALRETLALCMTAPRLGIIVPAAWPQDLIGRLEALAQDEGFSGQLRIKRDAAARSGDIAFDWGDGAVVINAKAIEDDVARILRANTDQGSAA
jgi:flagellar assembly protein FliH